MNITLKKLVFDATSDKICKICISKEPIIFEESYVMLCCNNILHEKCIMKWFKKKRICPICKKIQDICLSEQEAYSMLESAVYHCDINNVRILLQYGLDIHRDQDLLLTNLIMDDCDYCGSSYSCEAHDRECSVATFIEELINDGNLRTDTIIEVVIDNNKSRVMEVILKSVHLSSSFINSALIRSVEMACIEIAKMLLDYGANPSIMDGYLLVLAENNKHKAMIELLKEYIDQVEKLNMMPKIHQ